MKYGFGVDLGGTTVKIAYFDQEGNLLDKWEIPTVSADGGKQIQLFGNSHVDEVAAKYNLKVLSTRPIDPKLAELADAGMLEVYAPEVLAGAADAVAALL